MGEYIMNKFTTFAISTMLMVSFATADTYPAYGSTSYKTKQVNKAIGSEDLPYEAKTYLGLAYSYLSADFAMSNGIDYNIDGNSLTMLLGYDFHKYVAAEVRYSKTIGNLSESLENYSPYMGAGTDGDMSSFGLFVKPKYTSENIVLYGLLGYGKVQLDGGYIGEDSEASIQWGLGMSLDVGREILGNEKLTIFADYIMLYDEKDVLNVFTIESYTFGLNYAF